MANWKKVIVSGSNAELLTVTASFFKGDGSALTGVVAASANALTAGSGLHMMEVLQEPLLLIQVHYYLTFLVQYLAQYLEM